MLDDEPMLDEIAERNIRENEKMKLLLKMQKCKTLEDFQNLTKELEESIKQALFYCKRKEEQKCQQYTQVTLQQHMKNTGTTENNDGWIP